MKRNLLILVATSGIALSAHGADPITCYESTAVEIPFDYAVQGGYWGVALGYNYAPTLHYDPQYAVGGDFTNLVSFPTEMSQTSKAGYDVMLTTGYRYYSWRFEAELGFRNNKGNKITGLPSTADIPTLTVTPFFIPGPNLTDMPDVTATGSIDAITLMGNIIYDRYYTTGWMWSIGLGAGGSRINFGVSRSDVNFTTIADYSFSGYDFTHTTTNFAAQLILGVGYAWNQYVETALTYHFLYPLSSHYDVTNDFILGNPAIDANFTVQFKPNYFSHTLNLEFRFT